jgi:hypothetical protein
VGWSNYKTSPWKKMAKQSVNEETKLYWDILRYFLKKGIEM